MYPIIDHTRQQQATVRLQNPDAPAGNLGSDALYTAAGYEQVALQDMAVINHACILYQNILVHISRTPGLSSSFMAVNTASGVCSLPPV